MNSIYCLKSVGKKPTEDLWQALLVIARLMIASKRSELEFNHTHGDYVGWMDTNFESDRAENAEGILFHAKIRYSIGETSELLFIAGDCEGWEKYVELEYLPVKTFSPGGDPETNMWN